MTGTSLIVGELSKACHRYLLELNVQHIGQREHLVNNALMVVKLALTKPEIFLMFQNELLHFSEMEPEWLEGINNFKPGLSPHNENIVKNLYGFAWKYAQEHFQNVTEAVVNKANHSKCPQPVYSL